MNWQPLEVTVAEEENEEEKDNASSSLQKTEDRFKSLMADLKESVENKAAKKNRKVEAINQETVYSAIVEMIETSYPGGLDAMLKANEKLEDDI